jgi:hypothetical protein
MINERLEEIRTEVDRDIPECQKWRSDVQLKAFVAGQHDTRPRQWRQVLIEIERAIDAIDEAAIRQRQIERKIAEWGKVRMPEADDEAALLAIAHRQQARAMLGKMRELETLYSLYKSMPRFTYDQIEAAEAEYWRLRITRQAIHGILATGRIGVGDLDSMKQLGIPIEHVIEQVKPCMETIRKNLDASEGSGTSLLPSPAMPPQASNA